MPHQSHAIRAPRSLTLPTHLLPGVALCLTVAGSAYALENAERILFGKAWIEAMNLAIIIGAVAQSFSTSGHRTESGVNFCSKPLLDIAILLLGASISATTLLHASPYLLLGILALVSVTILTGLGVGRMLGVPFQQAALVACGNAICGNSAIVAVAPVIDAENSDVASCITFTALLGVMVVLLLPLAAPLLGLSATAYGTLAGLTVYAVPQVMAATSPIGVAALQTGMFVKLGRVLLLGPVCLVLSLVHRRSHNTAPLPFHRLVPWYIPGFFALMLCRSAGLIPNAALQPLQHTAGFLTVLAMAALGLRVNVKNLLSNNTRLIGTSVCSLLTLLGGALLITHWLYSA